LPSVIRVIKLRRIRWAGRHVARMGENMYVYRLLVGKAEGKRLLGYQDLVGCILGRILERWNGVGWSELVWLRIGRAGLKLVMNLWGPYNAGKPSSGLWSSAQLQRVSYIPPYCLRFLADY
jgi:hypothetical protein